jgi:hypothetical protein
MSHPNYDREICHRQFETGTLSINAYENALEIGEVTVILLSDLIFGATREVPTSSA